MGGAWTQFSGVPTPPRGGQKVASKRRVYEEAAVPAEFTCLPRSGYRSFLFFFSHRIEQKAAPSPTNTLVRIRTPKHTSLKKQEATILAVLEPYPAALGGCTKVCVCVSVRCGLFLSQVFLMNKIFV